MSVTALTLVKSMLDVTHTAKDTLIQALLDGAEQDVEDYCGFRLSSAARTEDVDGGGFGLWPTYRPVTAITSVTDVQTGEEVDSDDYTLKNDALFLDSGARWECGPPGRWRIVYTGGYSAVPAKVTTVILDLVYRMYHGKGGSAGQSAVGYSVNWAGSDSDLARRLRRFRHGAAVIG